jgi:predicted permease
MRRRDELHAQIDEELRFHIESHAQELMRSGLPREEAMRRARAELGSLAALRENSRQAWGTRWFDEGGGDLHYALRLLAKSPGFALIAIGSLALGIGANTVIFTAAQHALLDRLDVPHPEQLRLLEWTEPRDGVVEEMWGWFDDVRGGGERSTSFSYPVYQQLREQNRSLADIFAFKEPAPMTATIDGQAEAVTAEMVSGNFYSTLELRPQMGRGIQDSDDGAVGSGPVVTISDTFWSRRFGRSPQVIGKTILINGTPMTIVGVNPPGFTGAYSAQEHPDVFLPFSMQPVAAPQTLDPTWPPSLLGNKQLWWVLMMGRVKPGVPLAAAQVALNVQLSAAIRATMPVKTDSQLPHLLFADGSRGQNPNADDLTRPVAVLLGLAGFVLLLACANLATLLLARAGARQREMCVRLAMGAARRRILRQVLTESLLLSTMGGGAGLLLAAAVRNAIPRLMSVAGLAGALALGRVIGAMLYGLKPWDPATLAGSAALLLTVALAAGWIPARRAAGVDPMWALRHE